MTRFEQAMREVEREGVTASRADGERLLEEAVEATKDFFATNPPGYVPCLILICVDGGGRRGHVILPVVTDVAGEGAFPMVEAAAKQSLSQKGYKVLAACLCSLGSWDTPDGEWVKGVIIHSYVPGVYNAIRAVRLHVRGGRATLGEWGPVQEDLDPFRLAGIFQ